jgi:HSP20 family protein
MAGKKKKSKAEAEAREHPVQPKQELDQSEHATDFRVDGRLYAPLVDIYEDDVNIYIAADMPGVSPDDVEVSVRQHELVVNGRIVLEQYPDEWPLYQEYHPGHWHRHFQLTDDVDREGIDASISKGVLTIILPKSAKTKAKRIKVRTV